MRYVCFKSVIAGSPESTLNAENPQKPITRISGAESTILKLYTVHSAALFRML